ncbi:Cytochrome b561, DM13 and DOMON domain-containing protein [Gracilariopsis chorda]|uniref:Cytochrome b561, DM13 and DOMON domain-containing protein n=1 Tax=Gracilariopsis chorda TaxID=448386 RepID=A0A2V3ITH3_9FLOR|nr:Cytochrome b561, DM13 and DOMON domain-containing protein [Gracilariopsis chorda]|eukprot:PXF45423.1 Cytochrome b561, DM13 and DOMON domain-containing protein [Gracilariopsis chorda]
MKADNSRVLLFFSFAYLFHSITAHHRFSLTPVELATARRPSPRSEHLSVVVNSGDGPLLIVHGGRDAHGPKSDTWTYIVSQNRWGLLASNIMDSDEHPPPLFGTVGGYRFVNGQNSPFLYVALGTTDGVQMNTDMWVMEFRNFTWKRVTVDGDIPEPRYGAIGSLERFSKPDGSLQPALIISHGYGKDGPLSNTYKCSFDEKDPYKATWRKLRGHVHQYSTRKPHAMWHQASSFTANRDLVVFGGCYASERTGGLCPSNDVWLLEYQHGRTTFENDLESPTDGNESVLASETDSVKWRIMPRGPAPRIGAAMAQGLNSFEGAYESRLGIAVLYSGSQSVNRLPSSHIISAGKFDGSEIDIVSTQARTWLKERVHFTGPGRSRELALMPRQGASMDIVTNRTETDDIDTPNEFFLVFGGELENGQFSNDLLRISFDAYVESDVLGDSSRYFSRPLVHGLVMFFAWGVLMNAGAFIARYLKHPNGRPKYFVAHLLLQSLGLLLGWIGIGIAIYARRTVSGSFVHARLGIALIILASLQPFVASVGIIAQMRVNPVLVMINRPEAPRMILSRATRICRFIHRLIGSAVLVMGTVNITLGLFLIVAPTVLWVHWLVYAIILLITAGWLEFMWTRNGRQPIVHSTSNNRASIARRSSVLGHVVRSKRGEWTGRVQGNNYNDDEGAISQTDSVKDARAADEISAEDRAPRDEKNTWTRYVVVENYIEKDDARPLSSSGSNAAFRRLQPMEKEAHDEAHQQLKEETSERFADEDHLHDEREATGGSEAPQIQNAEAETGSDNLAFQRHAAEEEEEHFARPRLTSDPALLRSISEATSIFTYRDPDAY